MEYITKGGNISYSIPTVFFTSHPDDFDRSFNMITKDIFKTHNCAIGYNNNFSCDVPEWEIDTVNLVVVPITYKLLTTPNRAMDQEIPYIIEHNIPLLPILIDPGLDEIYTKQFGDIQYLNKISNDSTEISYADKLKKYLDSILIDDETVQKVRDAFDAYIFLSYRKIDRKYANELMSIIHDTPRFRDIAIWYDEFLVPGEDFRQNIERALNDSIMVTLLVTPSLLKDSNGVPNFIIREEYPAAAKSGKDIIPAEMEPTDRHALEEKFDGLSSCVDPRDTDSFRQRILSSLSRAAISPQKNDPIHNFLIGLAYLNGIDVEINYPRAIELISGSAEAGNKAAIEKMIDIYTTGQGIKPDNNMVIKYRLSLKDITKETYIADPTSKNLHEYLHAFFELANVHFIIRNYDNAYLYLEELKSLCEEFLASGEHDGRDTILYFLSLTLGVIANIDKFRRNFSHAKKLIERSIEIQKELVWNFEYTWTARNMAVGYRILSEITKSENNIVSAIEYAHKALNILKDIEESKYTDQFCFDVANALFNLSYDYRLITDYDNMLLYAIKAEEKIRSLIDLGVEECEGFYPGFINNLAESYRVSGNIEKAKELYKKSEQTLCDYYEKTGNHIHLHEILCKFRMGQCYFQQGDYTQCIDYIEKSLKIYHSDPNIASLVYDNGEDITTISHALLALSYDFIDNKQESLKHYRLGLQSADEHVADDRITINTSDYIIFYSNYAQMLNEAGDVKQSRLYFKKAEQLINKHKITPDNARLTSCIMSMYFNLANAYTKSEEFEKAIENFLKTEEMIDLLEVQGPHFLNEFSRLSCDYYLTLLYTDFDTEKAKIYALRSIEAVEKIPEEKRDSVLWDIMACCYYALYSVTPFLTRGKWKRKCQACIDILNRDFPDQYENSAISNLLNS